MAILNSQIIICKGVKMDRDYTNVLDYERVDMLELCNSSGIFVASYNNFSFIRKNKNTISADFTYEQAIQCNYMAFENPDYSNKWFFAWIDEVEYKGERCVEIHYTVDEWSTWSRQMNFQPVMVEREHTLDDSPRKNIQPEPISLSSDSYPGAIIINTDIGENPADAMYLNFDEYSAIIFYLPNNPQSIATNDKYVSMVASTPFKLSDATQTDSIAGVVNSLVGQGLINNIIDIVLYPTALIDYSPTEFFKPVTKKITVPMPDTLRGYVPENKKLFTYPYTFIRVDCGSSVMEYKYEDWDGGMIEHGKGHLFYLTGFPTPNPECVLYPVGYRVPEDRLTKRLSLKLNSFPQVAFPIDAYKAWLAQNANSQDFQIFSSALGGAVSGAAGGPWGMVAGAGMGLLNSITNRLSSEIRAKDVSDSYRGSQSGDVDTVMGVAGYNIQVMEPRMDDIIKIDNFFSQFGYATNRVKIPNMQGRQYWNYVKINGVCGYGNMPESSRMAINNILNNGVTIWHSHDYLGNYLIGGDKMQNPILP